MLAFDSEISFPEMKPLYHSFAVPFLWLFLVIRMGIWVVAGPVQARDGLPLLVWLQRPVEILKY